MQLSSTTKINELLAKYDFMLDFLVEVSPRFNLLKNPIARKTVGFVATLGQAALIGGIGVKELIAKIAAKIERETGIAVGTTGEVPEIVSITDTAARHEVLKEIIRDLHAGAGMASVKKRFQELIRDIDASEIAKMEQRLMEEGMPESEVKRLCDVHVQVFKESLEAKDVPVVPEGHPVHTLMLENRASENIMRKLEGVLNTLGSSPEDDVMATFTNNIRKLLASLAKIDLHFLRKENQLFPVLEKHDVAGPSQVMWSLHDDIRGMVKRAQAALDAKQTGEMIVTARELIATIRDMIFKEEHILYPLAVGLLSEDEWTVVLRGEEEIGYAWIEPAVPEAKKRTTVETPAAAIGKLSLDTGALSFEQINLLLKHLPLDISYVDEDDRVAYYSDTPERIFPRSAGVIGRKVQQCHPPSSVGTVQRILDDFREGTRSSAEFWLRLQSKFIHIRYFAVRNRDGAYKGCLEVSQEVSGIRALEGEKRLLD